MSSYRLPAACLALGLAACSPPPLEHDAYVWQRNWEPALTEALQQAAPQIKNWHVLAAEAAPGEPLRITPVNWPALDVTHRPVIMVIRIDGQLSLQSQPELQQQIMALWRGWRGHHLLIALEIDHDCASSHLADYARFLAGLRKALGEVPWLSITTLPAWLNAPGLNQVLIPVDEAVLQVHAVQNPQHGLFDPDQARRWIVAFSGHHKPFRVALPTYGSRIAYDANGQIEDIASEAPATHAGISQDEWIAAPPEVESLLLDLQNNPVANLHGVVWFRLPTRKDQRAWSMHTWFAVIHGASLTPRLTVHLEPETEAGLYHLILSNIGEYDAMLPASIWAPCPLGDALDGYSAGPSNNGYRFARNRQGLLHPGQHRLIGWLRCPMGASDEAASY